MRQAIGWYRQIKSFLFRDHSTDDTSVMRPRWNDAPAFPDVQSRPAMPSGVLDRRAIRLRRD